MRVCATLAALALCCAPAAFAQSRSDCPIASDAQSGIRLTRQTPLFDVVMRKQGTRVTEDRTSVFNGKKRRVKTTYLHGLIPLVRVEGSSRITQTLGNRATDFVTGRTVKRWTSPVEIKVNGKRFSNGKVTVRSAGNATWTGNGCTYKVKRVIVSTAVDGRAASHFEYFYAPLLGISLGGYKLGPDARTRIESILPERISRR